MSLIRHRLEGASCALLHRLWALQELIPHKNTKNTVALQPKGDTSGTNSSQKTRKFVSPCRIHPKGNISSTITYP